MKKSNLFFLFSFLFFLFPGLGLFAFGNREAEDERVALNPQWVLSITAPDVSGLPLARQITGDMVARTLASVLSREEFRFRGDEEYDFYRDSAWARARTEAARALQASRNERDLLIFRGDPSWRYERDLRRVNQTILEREAELERIDALAPLIERMPVFRLCPNNRNGTFPPPPARGGERRFCIDQGLDAFLTISLSEFHNRIFLHLRMFTLHTNSFSFEDYVLFFTDDITEVLEYVSGRLIAEISGTAPAAVLVHVTPEQALLLVDGLLVNPGEIHPSAPGEVEIAVWLENYHPLAIPVELYAGELSELFVNLAPLPLSAFEVDVPGRPGSRVFLGSKYLGSTPLTLELPQANFAYISVETEDGETGSMIFKNNSLVRGDVLFEPGFEGRPGRAVFHSVMPPLADEQRVSRARNDFYRAYGVFWIALPTSLLSAGFAANHINAWNRVGNPDTLDPDVARRLRRNAAIGNIVTIGAYAAIGASVGYAVLQVGRYIWAAREDARPMARRVTRVESTEGNDQ